MHDSALPEVNSNSLSAIGGKAHNLHRLLDFIPLSTVSYTVPKFIVIPVSVYQDAVSPIANQIKSYFESGGSNSKLLDIIKLHIASAAIPAEHTDVKRIIGKLELPSDSLIIVRSSATLEDGKLNSFAGQFHSEIGVSIRNEIELQNAIRKCWQAAITPAIALYCKHNHLPPPQMSLILQVLVNPTASGVMFTTDPTTNGANCMSVSAVSGLASQLVDGQTSGDQFTLFRQLPVAAGSKGDSQNQVRIVQGRVESIPIDPTKSKALCLNPHQLALLRQVGLQLEGHFQSPLDIEFAFVKDRLFLLQARPALISDSAGQHRILWDNANILESYAGLTLPLTFSVTRMAYQDGYESFGQKMGIPKLTHEANRNVLRSYIGMIKGRMYYNLRTWYVSMLAFPMSSFSSEAMESMMGLREGLKMMRLPVLDRKDPTRPVPVSRFLPRFLWAYFRNKRLVSDFLVQFDAKYNAFLQKIRPDLSMDACNSLYDEIRSTFKTLWHIPILSDVLTMLTHRRFEQLCQSLLPKLKAISGDLLANSGLLHSLLPIKEILSHVEQLKLQPDQAVKLRSAPDSGFSLAKLPEITQIWLQNFLAKYGSRTFDELKLEGETLHDRPERVIQMVLDRLDQIQTEVGSGQSDIRNQAEKLVRENLSAKQAKKVLAARDTALRHMGNREAMRMTRAKLYDLLRRLFKVWGINLKANGILGETADVFYLTVDELQEMSEGRSVTASWQQIVDMRKSEYGAWQTQNLPDRFATFGVPQLAEPQVSSQVNDSSSELHGTPCCSGVIEGFAVVCDDNPPEELAEGTILVARRTDPGWSPLFYKIAALVVERGSVLSHSAILARELGIPTIVGVANATKLLQTGYKIRIDGGTGVITVLTGVSAK